MIKMPVEGDIAVIGAGIIGICCAIFLQEQGFKVVLVDREPPAMGASKGNAGHFATEQVLPLASPQLAWQLPSMLLNPFGPVAIQWRYFFKVMPWWLRFLRQMSTQKYQQNSNGIAALNNNALLAYRDLLSRTGLKTLIRCQGSMLVFETQRAYLSYLNQLKAMQAQGVQYELMSGACVLKSEPALNTNIKAGIFFPDTWHTVNPWQFATQLFNYFRREGGLFKQAEVLELRRKHNGKHQGIKVKTTTGKSWWVPRLVLATGAWSKPWVYQLTGKKIPLDTERGYHLNLQGYQNIITMPVTSGERKFIMTPMNEGLRLAGTVEFAGLSLPPNMRRAKMLLPHAQALLPGLPEQKISASQCWMGCRPSLPDSLPVIDEDKGVYFAFGHQHLGLTQAAITALLVSHLVTGKRSNIDLTPYQLSRF
ncbi:NAD(P)/FAD-dependent oxidoreductase [Zooshikella sp. RANM57]|uniref:NAD(P)/FAD-dependent oxidoreductase n=1 Tax=Zooshikella sp. RANM57 TaxID=3425863 RepID=UPI003D6EFB64